MKAGCLDRFAFAKAALMQKALAAAGASPQSVAKAFKLQVRINHGSMKTCLDASFLNLSLGSPFPAPQGHYEGG